MNDKIYYKDGKCYRKIGRHEIIKPGAMHSWHHGELLSILGRDTIGDVPANFHDERDFYNPIETEKKEGLKILVNSNC